MESDQKTEIASRIKALRKKMSERGLEGMIVFDPVNIRYLSGFTGEFAIMLVSETQNILLVHYRNLPRARAETTVCSILPIESDKLLSPDDLAAKALTIASDAKMRHIGVDAALGHERFLGIRRQAKPIKLQVSDCVESCRMIKSEYEIRLLARAQAEAEKILQTFLKEIKPGITEKHLHHRLLALIYENDLLDGPSFLPIIASGESGWGVHSYYTGRKLKKNDSVIIDMGVKYKGYCSDMTRTVFLGKPTAERETVYKTVLEAQQAAEDTIKPGIYNHTADVAARKVITQSGYGVYFSHGLGHSIGLTTHEGPYLSYIKKRQVLGENMLFTLEPGIYMKNKFGVRIEDMVVLTTTGCRNLTGFTKEILVL